MEATARNCSPLFSRTQSASVTLLVIEDIHWADAATLDRSSFSRAESRASVLMLLTFRDDELDAASLRLARDLPNTHVTRIALQPVSTGPWKLARR
jgi:hypothetical protein